MCCEVSWRGYGGCGAKRGNEDGKGNKQSIVRCGELWRDTMKEPQTSGSVRISSKMKWYLYLSSAFTSDFSTTSSLPG